MLEDSIVDILHPLEHTKPDISSSLQLSTVLNGQTQDGLHFLELHSVESVDGSTVGGVDELNDPNGLVEVDVLGHHVMPDFLEHLLILFGASVWLVVVYICLFLGHHVAGVAEDRSYHIVISRLLTREVVNLVLKHIILMWLVRNVDLFVLVSLTCDAHIIGVSQDASLLELFEQDVDLIVVFGFIVHVVPLFHHGLFEPLLLLVFAEAVHGKQLIHLDIPEYNANSFEAEELREHCLHLLEQRHFIALVAEHTCQSDA
jgi:hypothetical protein